MKKFHARRERQHQEAIVRPIEIKDPSAELFSPSRSWQFDDPLQDSFLEQPEPVQPSKDCYRLPKLNFRTTAEDLSPFEWLPTSQDDASDVQPEGGTQPTSTMADLLPAQTTTTYVAIMPPSYYQDLEVVTENSPSIPSLPQRHPNHTHTAPVRSRSLPPSRDFRPLSVSPPKTNFQLFSQRCAPSPTSASPLATSPIFELSAEEAIFSYMPSPDSESPIELEGSPVEPNITHPLALHFEPMHALEQEPEASPYNRFTTLTKSIHALNANLSPIEETEEEAASRRSSIAQIYELPATAPFNPISPSAYSGGTTISSRNNRYSFSNAPELVSAPTRNTSTRSSDSAASTNSIHSMFSFEFTNSDTEKIYLVPRSRRRESSAPSLTDMSSIDDFDLDLELENRRSRSISKRDAKLERFFGIRQFSVSASSDLSSTSSTDSPASSTDSVYEHERGRTSLSIDDLDLSLSLENDPYRREIISMHKSILSKSQSKQDAKLEKFFGCDIDQIQIARKSSTGSRLAGCTDDLKYRSIGWS